MAGLEFISDAAVKVDTTIFRGANHSQCIKKLKSATTQGFIADQYSGSRFVDRKEALEIAIDAGQNITKHSPKNQLLSEDLREDKRFRRHDK